MGNVLSYDMQEINRDLFGYSPNNGSMHTDTPNAPFPD